MKKTKKKVGESSIRTKSRSRLESDNSSISDEIMDINELIKYELKKTENFKLGDLKQGIEENIVKMTQGNDVDEEGKFNIMLCKNIKNYLFLSICHEIE